MRLARAELGTGWTGGADRCGGALLGRGGREDMDVLWCDAARGTRGWAARGCGSGAGCRLRVCVETEGAAEDLRLQRTEPLQAVGEALQDERGVGGVEGVHRAGEVGGFGALAERRSDAFGPGDEQPNDEEQDEGGRRRAAGLGPGGGGR